jgi:hypothetical protein
VAALRAECDRLRAENARLKSLLAADEPEPLPASFHPAAPAATPSSHWLLNDDFRAEILFDRDGLVYDDPALHAGSDDEHGYVRRRSRKIRPDLPHRETYFLPFAWL